MMEEEYDDRLLYQNTVVMYVIVILHLTYLGFFFNSFQKAREHFFECLKHLLMGSIHSPGDWKVLRLHPLPSHRSKVLPGGKKVVHKNSTNNDDEGVVLPIKLKPTVSYFFRWGFLTSFEETCAFCI